MLLSPETLALLRRTDIDDQARGTVPRECGELRIAAATKTLWQVERRKIAGDRQWSLTSTRDIDHIDTQRALELPELGHALRAFMHCSPRTGVRER